MTDALGGISRVKGNATIRGGTAVSPHAAAIRDASPRALLAALKEFSDGGDVRAKLQKAYAAGTNTVLTSRGVQGPAITGAEIADANEKSLTLRLTLQLANLLTGHAVGPGNQSLTVPMKLEGQSLEKLADLVNNATHAIAHTTDSLDFT